MPARPNLKSQPRKTNVKKKSFFRFLVKTALWLILILAVFAGITNYIMITSAGARIVAQNDVKKADAIIVLGALVWDSGQPSYMLQDRLDVAYELYQAGAAPKILVSGDHGTKEYDEVNGMRKYLEGRGVPPEAIFMDHAGFDTYDTMYRARDVFLVKSAIVVTQRYHQYRAIYLAERMGLDVQGVACDRYKSLKQPWYDVREIAARAKDYIQAELLKPKPSSVNDNTYPISGSGITTRD